MDKEVLDRVVLAKVDLGRAASDKLASGKVDLGRAASGRAASAKAVTGRAVSVVGLVVHTEAGQGVQGRHARTGVEHRKEQRTAARTAPSRRLIPWPPS